MSIDLELAKRLEELLLCGFSVEQGLELWAGLFGEPPGWVRNAVLIWRLYEYGAATTHIGARLEAGKMLFNVGLNQAGGALRPWVKHEDDAVRSLFYPPGRLRLLRPEQAETLSSLSPASAPYLRTCVPRGWSPGVLVATMVEMLP